jgi:predicted DNA-binding protein (UPF0251 family)
MKYYTQSEAAKKAKLSRFTIWKFCKSGQIKTSIITFIKGGKEIQTPVIEPDELERFIKSRTSTRNIA